MKKEYKKINGFDYLISNYGDVVSLKTNKEMSLVINNKNKPYHRVGLMKDGKRHFFLVHRLVAEAFIDNTDNKPHVNHINEIKNDNRVSNLEWTTNKLNIRYSNKKKINQLTLSGEIINTWDALHLIGDAGYSKSSVCMALKSNYKIKSAHGYKWQYV